MLKKWRWKCEIWQHKSFVELILCWMKPIKASWKNSSYDNSLSLSNFQILYHANWIFSILMSPAQCSSRSCCCKAPKETIYRNSTRLIIVLKREARLLNSMFFQLTFSWQIQIQIKIQIQIHKWGDLELDWSELTTVSFSLFDLAMSWECHASNFRGRLFELKQNVTEKM